MRIKTSMLSASFSAKLWRFLTVIDVELDLLVRVVDLAVHLKTVADLVARRPKDHVGALVYKRQQALNQVVDKAVLVQIVRLDGVDVEDARGVDATIVARRQELRVLAQMTDAVGADLFGERDLVIYPLPGGDEAARIFDDGVDGVERVLDHADHSSSTTLTSSSRCCSIVVPQTCAISNR